MILHVNGVSLTDNISGVARVIEAILRTMVELEHPFQRAQSVRIGGIDRQRAAAGSAECPTRQTPGGRGNLPPNPSVEHLADTLGEAELDAVRAVPHQRDLGLGQDHPGGVDRGAHHVPDQVALVHVAADEVRERARRHELSSAGTANRDVADACTGAGELGLGTVRHTQPGLHE